MKKVMIIAVIAVFGFTSVQAQDSGIRLGVNFGLPVGDADEFSSFNLGFDAVYLLTVADSFQIGPSVGYSHFFGKEHETILGTRKAEDIQFIPLAGAFRFFASHDLFFGADLGYAVGISDGNDGGFYYRPKIGYSLGQVAMIASYSGISMDNDITMGSLNLGIEFGF